MKKTRWQWEKKSWVDAEQFVRSSFVSSTKVFLNHGKNSNMFLVKPSQKRRVLVPLRKVVKHPVVAAVG